jgi:hypothetical protein
MTAGTCMRCGAVGPIERDHPDGRYLGRPLLPAVVVELCRPCHLTKGLLDRAAGVEGGQPTLCLVTARRAAWVAFLATTGQPVVLTSQVLDDFAGMLGGVALQIPAHVLWKAKP